MSASATCPTTIELSDKDGFTTHMKVSATDPKDQKELDAAVFKMMFRFHEILRDKHHGVVAKGDHRAGVKNPLCGVGADEMRAFSKTHAGKSPILRVCDGTSADYGTTLGIKFIGTDGKARDTPTKHLKDRDLSAAYGDKSQFFRRTQMKIHLQRKLDARKLSELSASGKL